MPSEALSNLETTIVELQLLAKQLIADVEELTNQGQS